MKYCRQSQNRSCDLSRFQTNYYARMGLITQRYLYILGIALQWNMTKTRLQVFIKRDYVEIVGYKNLLVYVTLCMTYFNTRKYYFLNPSIFPCFNFIYVVIVLFMKFTPFEGEMLVSLLLPVHITLFLAGWIGRDNRMALATFSAN